MAAAKKHLVEVIRDEASRERWGAAASFLKRCADTDTAKKVRLYLHTHAHTNTRSCKKSGCQRLRLTWRENT